jgi:hypothetical protein
MPACRPRAEPAHFAPAMSARGGAIFSSPLPVSPRLAAGWRGARKAPRSALG